MTIRCPTCGGAGKVPWVPPHDGGPWCISPWPTEACRTCGGLGWVEDGPTPAYTPPVIIYTDNTGTN